MYAIRVEPAGRRLAIHCSERLTTGEAVRAINQAALLCEASRLTVVTCDVREVRRGPGSSIRVAAAIAAALHAGQRVAILARPDQQASVRRVVRFSGQTRAVRAFTDAAMMDAWLAGGRKELDLFRSPTGRHLELVTTTAATATPGRRRRTRAVG